MQGGCRKGLDYETSHEEGISGALNTGVFQTWKLFTVYDVEDISSASIFDQPTQFYS